MMADERRERVQRAIEATVSGDTSAVGELFTADVVASSPTVTVSSRVELAVELEDHDDELSEIAVATGPMVADGNRVCAEWVMTATHLAPGPCSGSSEGPAGRRVMRRGATVAEFAGDRICAMRHYWDESGALTDPPDPTRH
jgi:hypothetical protein